LQAPSLLERWWLQQREVRTQMTLDMAGPEYCYRTPRSRNGSYRACSAALPFSVGQQGYYFESVWPSVVRVVADGGGCVLVPAAAWKQHLPAESWSRAARGDGAGPGTARARARTETADVG
jgi:hypothetical protein